MLALLSSLPLHSVALKSIPDTSLECYSPPQSLLPEEPTCNRCLWKGLRFSTVLTLLSHFFLSSHSWFFIFFCCVLSLHWHLISRFWPLISVRLCSLSFPWAHREIFIHIFLLFWYIFLICLYWLLLFSCWRRIIQLIRTVLFGLAVC